MGVEIGPVSFTGVLATHRFHLLLNFAMHCFDSEFAFDLLDEARLPTAMAPPASTVEYS